MTTDATKRDPSEVPIFPGDARVHFHAQTLRFDPQQIQVKKCVDVRPQEEAIFRMVVIFPAVRADMCRLKYRQDLARGHDATVPIPSPQGVTELTLTPPSAYLPFDQRPAIDPSRNILIPVVRFSVVRLLGTQGVLVGPSVCRTRRILRLGQPDAQSQFTSGSIGPGRGPF